MNWHLIVLKTVSIAGDGIVTLIEQQRQDQERMLRSLATGKRLVALVWCMLTFLTELSNDIRGERLRFVEAMKEATTINVQSTCSGFVVIPVCMLTRAQSMSRNSRKN